MLNLTLLSLSLNSIMLNSPYLSNTRDLVIKKCDFLNSFSSFLYNSQSLIIESSKFVNFLDSAITIDRSQNNVCMYNDKYTTRPEPPKTNDIIICKDSVFIGCRTKHDGGAFNHFSPNFGSLFVTRTTFYDCQSGPNPADGGCIYFSGKESHINQTSCVRCTAGRDGHAFCISIRNEQPEPNHCNQTSIYMCAPKDAARGWQSLYLGFGNIRITNLNSSENAVITQSGSFMMHTMDSDARALHCTVYGNIGPWIVYFFGYEGSSIEFSNFVDNTLARGHESGLIKFYQKSKISNCFISHQQKVFDPNNERSSLIVTKCIFDGPITRNKFVTMNDCQFKPDAFSTLPLAHFNTEICPAELPLSSHPNLVQELKDHMQKYDRTG